MELLAALPTSATCPASCAVCGESEGDSADCDAPPVLTFCCEGNEILAHHFVPTLLLQHMNTCFKYLSWSGAAGQCC